MLGIVFGDSRQKWKEMTRKSITIHFLSLVTVAFCRVRPAVDAAEQSAPSAVKFTSEYCSECHSGSDSEGNLDFDQLPTNLESAASRARWVDIHDRVQTLEMPPAPKEVSSAERATFLQELSKKLHKADLAEVVKKGRGPIRRLNRDEYQQNLRDILKLPALDIRDMLPEDRESHHFNKTTETLDISRVQLVAYLDAAEAALLRAMASLWIPNSQRSHHQQ